jgi:Molybdate transporter of MFS superfamily
MKLPGAGGLAAQHRLGANTGLSMIMLGLFKLSMSLLAAQGSLLRILDALPISILGVLVIMAGHELAAAGVLQVAKSTWSSSSPSSSATAAVASLTSTNTAPNSGRTDAKSDVAMVVCLITGLVIVGTGHAHFGAISGWIAHIIYGGGGDLPWGDCHIWNLCCGRRRWNDEGGGFVGDSTTAGRNESHQCTPLDQRTGPHSALYQD